MMAVSRWWQLAIGVVIGTLAAFYMPAASITITIVLGLLLAWASLTSDGDDVLTAMAAGFLTGVLGWGVFRISAILFGAPF